MRKLRLASSCDKTYRAINQFIASSRFTLPNTWTFRDWFALHYRWTDEAVSWVVDSILGSGIGTGNGIVVLDI